MGIRRLWLIGPLSIALASPLPLSAQGGAGRELRPLKIAVGEKLTTVKNVGDLLLLASHIKEQRYKDCLVQSAKAEQRHVELRAWIYLFKLTCATKQYVKEKKLYLPYYSIVENGWKNSDWLLYGPQAKRLRQALIASTLELFEYAHKYDRARAWPLFDDLVEFKDNLDASSRAKMYYLAAELAAFQQNLPVARELYEKSLKEDSNDIVRKKYEAFVRTLAPELAPPASTSVTTSHNEATPEEIEVYKRMNDSIAAGDLLAATQDGVKLIREYPGGKRAADAAKKILSIYLGIVSRSEEKYQILRDQVLLEMRKVDAQRLYEWAQAIVFKEKFDDVVKLAQDSLERVGGQPISSKILLLAAVSAQHMGDFKRARSYYDTLVKKHAGSAAAAEALFRVGLLDYREEKYAEAANHLEIFLQANEGSEFELSALYWLWRSHQKTGATAEKEVSDRLLKKYPLSYYAMRVRAEYNGGKVTFADKPTKTLDWTFQLTPREYQAWENFLMLSKAGFAEESRLELALLSEPAMPLGKLIYAYMWSEAGDYVKASETLARTYALDSGLIYATTLRVAYPIMYFEEIKKESEKYSYPPELVMALIKQESSYRSEVRSPAGAMGLMQLMPETAKEIATDIRLKFSDISKDLTIPNFNIRVGSHYLNRLLRVYNGHVPLALAAYNAGIGNIKGWQQSRTDLASISEMKDSAPINELWIDELPWAETSGYIKSILRNVMVYRFLDQGEYNINNPIWTFAD